jgi:NAD dependent epimerase/dehydratase family enzyme
VTNKEFSKLLGKTMRRPVWLPVPEFALRLAFGEVAELTIYGQRVVPLCLMQHGYKFKYPWLVEAFSEITGK